MPIVDQFGRPYSAPPREVAVAQVAGVPRPATAWASVASSLTPLRAAAVIRAARNGDAEQYLTLAEEIEERDLHYASVLQTRKLGVLSDDPEVIPGDDTPRAEEIADAFRERVVEKYAFTAMLFDLMDAVSKGYSVVQPVWKTTADGWDFAEFRWHDPRLFMFDRVHLRELRIRTPVDSDGVRLPPGVFVVHYPMIKTGVRIRGGLAMLATLAHVAKSYTLADWLAFCEVYGMPLRIASFDPNVMTQPEIDALKIAVANIGHDAAAIIPYGAEIKIEDARRPNANGKNVFEGLANYWDAQLSKAVLGQTMTTDDGSSKSQAEVHDAVRLDIRRADARALRATVHEGIAVPWTYFNYGPDAPVPQLRLPVDPPEDLKTFTDALVPWVERAGLTVRASEIRERFGLSAPDGDDEQILGLPAARDPGGVVAAPAPGAETGGGAL